MGAPDVQRIGQPVRAICVQVSIVPAIAGGASEDDGVPALGGFLQSL
jgi:hypothetical protein